MSQSLSSNGSTVTQVPVEFVDMSIKGDDLSETSQTSQAPEVKSMIRKVIQCIETNNACIESNNEALEILLQLLR
jgi:hypothetical protein